MTSEKADGAASTAPVAAVPEDVEKNDAAATTTEEDTSKVKARPEREATPKDYFVGSRSLRVWRMTSIADRLAARVLLCHQMGYRFLLPCCTRLHWRWHCERHLHFGSVWNIPY